MVTDERAVACEEVQQVGHLLEVRRNVGVVAPEVHVVELHIDDVLDVTFRRDRPVAALAVTTFGPGAAQGELFGRRPDFFARPRLAAPTAGQERNDRCDAQYELVSHDVPRSWGTGPPRAARARSLATTGSARCR